MCAAPAHLSPDDLLESATGIRMFRVAAAEDVVVVARLDKGGLISYSRTDGTYLHTLNTEEGFERKLSNLGVVLETE